LSPSEKTRGEGGDHGMKTLQKIRGRGRMGGGKLRHGVGKKCPWKKRTHQVVQRILPERATKKKCGDGGGGKKWGWLGGGGRNGALLGA